MGYVYFGHEKLGYDTLQSNNNTNSIGKIVYVVLNVIKV